MKSVLVFATGLFAVAAMAQAPVPPPPSVTASADATAVAAPANAAVGRWKTIDDETKEAKSIVVITEVDGKLVGTIEKLFRKEGEDQNPKCEKCSGDKKDQPIIGMQILQGLKKDKGSETKWSGGEILDPKNGKTYSCKLEVVDGGKKLDVRGFVGFSLIGRTQTWVRE